MKLVGGYPYWLIQDGLSFAYPSLLENISCPVVILGGGISGALTAYYLTEAGINCILVDGRSIGLGSTCASTALLQYELDEPLHRLTKKIGEQKAVKAYQLCGNSIARLVDIMHSIGFSEFDLQRSLLYSAHRSELNFMKKELAARARAGFEVSLLSKDNLRSDYGMEAEYGILSELGATINAYALTHALLQYSIKKGLAVFDRTMIDKVEYAKTGVKLTTASGLTIQADKLVNASGYEIVEFLDKKIVDLHCTYALVSESQYEKDAIWKDRLMIWNTDDPYLYMRLTKDNRILLGGRDERFSHKTLRHLHGEKSSLLKKDFSKLFRGIQFETEFSWSGVFGKTKDSLPYIGSYKKTPNTCYALGFGGNGITFSVIAAEIIRDLVLGRKNENAELFSFERSQ